MINRTVLVGRITRDIELKKTQSGKSVASFTLACNRKFGDKEQADFINCVAWNQQADFLANYIRKGALLGVEGRIQSRTYEDATGKTVFVQEVVCESVQALESRNSRESQAETQYDEPQYANETPLEINADDLPF